MKLLYLASLFCCIAVQSAAQYNDPNFPVPASGYGSDGTHTVGVVSFTNPYFTTENIEIYHPADISTPVPTLFYSHAYGGNLSSHVIGLLEFVAKKGYAIVFVPYQTTNVSIADRYQNLREGFRKAARDYPGIIDTTRVGFMGHSFGGGATIANSYICFTENNWGQNGRYIHPSAPWYSYEITQTELQSFPSDVKLLMEIYDNDVVNDHRMAVDIFTNINIPASEKDFITVKADTVNSYIYSAGHDLPTTYAAFDALDYYAYYRLIDALCDYTFNGSLAGKDVALGNGSLNQISMPPGLKSLVQTDTPQALYPESTYGFPCSGALNPRTTYCTSATAVSEFNPQETALSVYPNPASDQLTVLLPEHTTDTDLKVYNSTGQQVLSVPVSNQHSLAIDLTSFSAGLYFIRCGEMKIPFLIE